MAASQPKRSRCENCGCFYFQRTHNSALPRGGYMEDPGSVQPDPAASVKGGCTNCGRIDVENLASPVGDDVWSSNREIWVKGNSVGKEEVSPSSSASSFGSPSCASNGTSSGSAKAGGGSGALSVTQRILAAEWIREMDQLFDAHSDTIIEHSEGEPFNTLWLDGDRSAAPIPVRPIPLTTLLPVWKKKIEREAAEERGEVNMDEAPSCA